MNSIDAFSKRFDYENESLNNTCLFTLQNKFQNITIAKIEFSNDDFNEKNINFEKENENELNVVSNARKKYFFKQTFRRKNVKKTFTKKFVYSNVNEKFLNKIKIIQFENKFCDAQKRKFEKIKFNTKRNLTINKILLDA